MPRNDADAQMDAGQYWSHSNGSNDIAPTDTGRTPHTDPSLARGGRGRMEGWGGEMAPVPDGGALGGKGGAVRVARWVDEQVRCTLQGFLAHKKHPPP